MVLSLWNCDVKMRTVPCLRPVIAIEKYSKMDKCLTKQNPSLSSKSIEEQKHPLCSSGFSVAFCGSDLQTKPDALSSAGDITSYIY